jgi:hypothetical protein
VGNSHVINVAISVTIDFLISEARATWGATVKRDGICLARVRVICFGIIMGVLSAAGSTEFLRYVYRFLAFFAIVQ